MTLDSRQARAMTLNKTTSLDHSRQPLLMRQTCVLTFLMALITLVCALKGVIKTDCCVWVLECDCCLWVAPRVSSLLLLSLLVLSCFS